jgi:hypothetical protein
MPARERTTGDDLPEIRVEAYDKIDQWREKLDKTEKLKKRDIFERAAADLFLEAEYERDLRAVQAITDAVYFLGRDYAGLSNNDIQYIMVGAKAEAECPINGRAALDGKPSADEEPPPPDDFGFSNERTTDEAPTGDGAAEQRPTPLPFINIADWDNESVPQQEWAVPDRIPLRQCALFSGDSKGQQFVKRSAILP